MNKTATPSTVNKGFLLTRQSYDVHGQSQITLWLNTEKGPARLCISAEHPVFFIQQVDIQPAGLLLKSLNNNFSHKQLKLKTFNQQVVAGLYFNNLRAFYDARTLLVDAGIEIYESNIRLEERYLMERFVYGGVKFTGIESSVSEQTKKGYIEYRNIKIKPGDYVPTFNTVSLDIECSEKGELYSIGFYTGGTDQGNCCRFKKVIMIQPDQLSDDEAGVDYIEWVNNEVELLRALEKTIQLIDPDIIIGWNVINFDFRLLTKRAALHNLTPSIIQACESIS